MGKMKIRKNSIIFTLLLVTFWVSSAMADYNVYSDAGIPYLSSLMVMPNNNVVLENDIIDLVPKLIVIHRVVVVAQETLDPFPVLFQITTIVRVVKYLLDLLVA